MPVNTDREDPLDIHGKIRDSMTAADDCINECQQNFRQQNKYRRRPEPHDPLYRLHRQMQVAVLNYYDAFKEYGPKVPDEWEETIFIWNGEEFSLSDVSRLREGYLGFDTVPQEVKVAGKPNRVNNVDIEVLLPLDFAIAIRDQLNACVWSAGFPPEVVEDKGDAQFDYADLLNEGSTEDENTVVGGAD